MKNLIDKFISEYILFYMRLCIRASYLSLILLYINFFLNNLSLWYFIILLICSLVSVHFMIFFEATYKVKSLNDLLKRYRNDTHYLFYEIMRYRIDNNYLRIFSAYYSGFINNGIIGLLSAFPLVILIILYSYISYFSFIFLIVATPLIREIYYKILKVDEFSTIKEYTEEEMAEHRKAYTSINFSALNYFKDSDMLFKLMFSLFLIGFIAFIVYFAVIS